MFNFDVKALLSKIETTLVPELPADYHPEKLEKYVAAVLGQLILASEDERLELMKEAIPEAQRINDQMLEFTTYLAGINKAKFMTFAPEQQSALEKLSVQVQRSTSVAHVYSFTLLIIGGQS